MAKSPFEIVLGGEVPFDPGLECWCRRISR
jgi:hypothetical protein